VAAAGGGDAAAAQSGAVNVSVQVIVNSPSAVATVVQGSTAVAAAGSATGSASPEPPRPHVPAPPEPDVPAAAPSGLGVPEPGAPGPAHGDRSPPPVAATPVAHTGLPQAVRIPAQVSRPAGSVRPADVGAVAAPLRPLSISERRHDRRGDTPAGVHGGSPARPAAEPPATVRYLVANSAAPPLAATPAPTRTDERAAPVARHGHRAGERATPAAVAAPAAASGAPAWFTFSSARVADGGAGVGLLPLALVVALLLSGPVVPVELARLLRWHSRRVSREPPGH
jgi:hypothetical protein